MESFGHIMKKCDRTPKVFCLRGISIFVVVNQENHFRKAAGLIPSS